MISVKTLNKIEKEAKKYFKGAFSCHDWSHVERVRNIAIHIGKKEKANLKILELAAILHDIGRKKEMELKGALCHAEKGAEMAKNILAKYKISDKDAKNIVHCIITHRFRNNHIPKTIEAKVLYDADKLDSIGAVGIGRAFLFAGKVGAKLYNDKNTDIYKTKAYSEEDSAYREFTIKLSKVKNKMLTKEGERIAEIRHKFMVEYFKIFQQEVNGKR